MTPSSRLAEWLSRLSNNNAQREYSLTDIIALAVAEGLPVRTAQTWPRGAYWQFRRGQEQQDYALAFKLTRTMFQAVLLGC